MPRTAASGVRPDGASSVVFGGGPSDSSWQPTAATAAAAASSSAPPVPLPMARSSAVFMRSAPALDGQSVIPVCQRRIAGRGVGAASSPPGAPLSWATSQPEWGESMTFFFIDLEAGQTVLPRSARSNHAQRKPIPDGYSAIHAVPDRRGRGRIHRVPRECIRRRRSACVFPCPRAASAHAEVEIGGAVLMLSDAAPPDFPVNNTQIHLYVEDVDSVYARAVSAGATVIAEPAGPVPRRPPRASRRPLRQTNGPSPARSRTSTRRSC